MAQPDKKGRARSPSRALPSHMRPPPLVAVPVTAPSTATWTWVRIAVAATVLVVYLPAYGMRYGFTDDYLQLAAALQGHMATAFLQPEIA